MDAFELLLKGAEALNKSLKISKKSKPIVQIEDSILASDVIVYTDGACSRNGSANAAAGIGVYFGEGDPRNLSKRVEGKQTNNTAELGAVLEAYKLLEKEISSEIRVGIVSDSEYAIRCATSYGAKCASNGWKDAIPNKDLVRRTYELFAPHSNVQFFHVMAHTLKSDVHSKGNEEADHLANKAIGLSQCPYSAGCKLVPKEVQDRIYVQVPFAQKDVVKGMGGKWDASKKSWYILESCVQKEQILSIFPRR